MLLYKARALIALNDTKTALGLIPSGSENIAVKAAASLARFVDAAGDEAKSEAALEELRDLSVELEGEEDVEGTEQDIALARVLVGTAFARAGEIEEALETLDTETEDLEAYVFVSHCSISINHSSVLGLSCRFTFRSTDLISPGNNLNARSVGLRTTYFCNQ